MIEKLLCRKGIPTRLSLFFIGFLLAFSGWAQTTYEPIVEVYNLAGERQDDFSPGETAVLKGTGWTQDQFVDVHLHEDPEYDHDHDYHGTPVDVNGNWEIQYPIEERHLGVTFNVEVIGLQTGKTASTVFTDGSWTISANPLTLCVNVATLVTFTITQTSNGGFRNQSYGINLPSGYTVTSVSTPSISGKSWSGTFPSSSQICLSANNIASNNQMDNNDVLTFTATITASTSGISVLPTSYAGNSQTCVYVAQTGSPANRVAFSNVLSFTAFAQPTVTSLNACIGGGDVTFTQSGGASGGTWSVTGGGTIVPGTGVFTPTTAGCFTATYTTPTGGCFDTKSFVVFPAAPAIPLVSNRCDSSLTIPALTVVAGFTAQYSFDSGSSWGTSNSSTSTTPGCYSMKTRYVLTNACGLNLANTPAPAACAASGTANAVILPFALTAPEVNIGCGAIIVTPPPTIPDFNIQYSFNDGDSWGANIPPTEDNCSGYKIKTRYVLTTNCGLTPSGFTSDNCSTSFATTRVVDNTAPTADQSAGLGDANLECDDTSGLTTALAFAPSFTDNCTAVVDITMTSDVTTVDPDCANAYVQVRKWTASDGCTNTSLEYVQTITVTDTNAPVVDQAAASLDATLECSNTTGIDAALALVPTATDNCTAEPTLVLVSDVTTADATCANAYVRVRTWNFTDGCDNTSADFVQTITVQDTEAPMADQSAGLGDATLECDDTSGLTTALAFAPTFSDTCTGSLSATLISDVKTPDANCANAYVQVRKWASSDGCSNTSLEYVQTITVVDTNAPVLGLITAPSGPVQIGTAVNLTATYSDCSIVTAIWHFSSDGITYEYSKAGDVVGNSIEFNNTEPKIPAGVYNIKLKIIDACGNTLMSDPHTEFLVIYDPSGGFVTGGGWFNSLPGNMPYNPTAYGKANFGFNAKYKTGKNNLNEVDGNTNFQFKEGDFHFKSSSHKAMSLVISGERKATYKGSGTVNGSGSYDFMVTVIDGEAPGAGPNDYDSFRIKVWVTGSPSTVVYDNEGGGENEDATTVLGGGSIVIHKPKGNSKAQEDITKGTPIIMQDLRPEILETLAASPNPVVSFSTVRFSVKEDALVTLRLFDHSGRMIETLFQGNVKALENYDVDFQRRNLMSGIYIVKLTTATGHSYEKRIIIN